MKASSYSSVAVRQSGRGCCSGCNHDLDRAAVAGNHFAFSFPFFVSLLAPIVEKLKANIPNGKFSANAPKFLVQFFTTEESISHLRPNIHV